MSRKIESQFIKADINPSSTEIITFGEELKVFNNRLLNKQPVNAVAATKTFTTFSLQAKVKGVVGNKINVTLIDSSETDCALSVIVDGKDIVVTLEKVANVITTTGSDLVTFLNNNISVSDLVVASGSNATVVSATGKTFLTGGIDGTFAPSEGFYFIDGNFLYMAINKNTISDSNWRRISLGMY